jgi:hypothetical protein
MGVLEESQRKYNNSRIEIQDFDYKIGLKHRQIERLEKRKEKIRSKNWWGDVLIRPVMEDIKVKFPQLTWDTERLVPMGLRCAVSVFGHDKDDKTLSAITFTPGDKGQLYYDTGEKKNNYPQGTLGSLNGMDNKEALLTDMEQLYEHVRRQCERNELTHLR